MTTEYLKPSFFIVGEQKCGTSSLFRYLTMHPQILPGKLKEPNFWAGTAPQDIPRRFPGYLAQFPPIDATETTMTWPELDAEGVLYEEDVFFERGLDGHVITGEASANTFFWVDPRLVHSYLPGLVIIIILRNPVDRAFSHHRMFKRFQDEGRDLGFSVSEFEHDMRREMNHALQGKYAPSISPGFYVERLKRWTNIWGTQLKIITSDDLANPERCVSLLKDLESTLELKSYLTTEHIQTHFNQAPKDEMSKTIRTELYSFYRSEIRSLSTWLKRDLLWHS